MPSNFLAERSGNQRGRDDSAIDEDVINLERVRAAVVAGGVEPADLAREVSLKTTDPSEQTSQRDEKRHIECHQEMAHCHERRADRNCKSAAEPAISDQAANDRREIDESCVKAKNRGSERLNIERAAKEFDRVPKRTEPSDVVDVWGMQQPIDHVKDEQRLHTVVGETFPGIGKSDVGEPARVPDKTAVHRIVHEGELESRK